MTRTQKMTSSHIILTITLWILANLVASTPLPMSASVDPYVLNKSPDEINNGLTENVTLECMRNPSIASSLNQISRIRILKEGADGNWDPIAEKRDTGQTIQLHASVMITGHIDNGIDGMDAYLKVTWPLAMTGTFGQYRCDVIAFDQNHDIAVESTAAVMIVEHNITAREVLTVLLEDREEFKHTLNDLKEGLGMKPRWPEGTFGLLQANNQCPGGINWRYGYIQMHTEEFLNANRVSGAPHMSIGTLLSINRLHFMKLSVCVITKSYPGLAWPAGSYCIMRRGGTCPNGFNSGYIKIDTEDRLNEDSMGGYYTDDSAKLQYFCCRSDGSPRTPIVLPTEDPFYLFRYQGSCQNVVGMNVAREYITIDTEDSNNADEYENTYHPDGGINDITLELCYYST